MRVTEVIISALPSIIKEGDTFLFSESRVILKVSLLGIANQNKLYSPTTPLSLLLTGPHNPLFLWV